MSLDLLLTIGVVAVACYFVIRKFLKSGTSCSGDCGCSAPKKTTEIADLRDKEKQE